MLIEDVEVCGGVVTFHSKLGTLPVIELTIEKWRSLLRCDTELIMTYITILVDRM